MFIFTCIFSVLMLMFKNIPAEAMKKSSPQPCGLPVEQHTSCESVLVAVHNVDEFFFEGGIANSTLLNNSAHCRFFTLKTINDTPNRWNVVTNEVEEFIILPFADVYILLCKDLMFLFYLTIFMQNSLIYFPFCIFTETD